MILGGHPISVILATCYPDAMNAVFFETLKAPWGTASLAFDCEGQLLEVSLRSRRAVGVKGQRPEGVPSSSQLKGWLRDYLQAKSPDFPGSWAIPGKSDFRRKVYRAVAAIPTGQTLSYGEVAQKAGSPGAARAVGSAMAQNPLTLVVP
jgi:methylated-DNA-[protein]-cysteine S-methyltransferase